MLPTPETQEEETSSVPSMETIDIAVQGEHSLEEALYENVYRKRGIRRYQNFLVPIFSPLDTFELPKGSIVHYIPTNDVELGITPSHFFLRRASGALLADNVAVPATLEGNPIKVPVSPSQLVQRYRKANRRIRVLQKYETALRNPLTVAIVNYAMINHMYRYRKTLRTRLFKYQNTMNTFVAKVNELAEITDRQQYLELGIPKRLPTRASFVRASVSENIRILNEFGDDGSLTLLEIWKWLGEDRGSSILAKLSPKAISSINLVWNEAGRYVIMSLAKLDEWRKDPETGKGKVEPKQLQLGYMKFLNSMFDLHTATAKTTIEVNVDDDGSEDLTSIVVDGQEMDELLRVETEAKEKLAAGEDDDYDEELDDNGLKFIPREDDADEPNPPTEGAELSVGVVSLADDLLESGMISVPEHRRFTRLASKYEEIPDPYGSGKMLSEVIKPDLNIIRNLKEEQFKDDSGLLDKSMLKSTLADFDKNYINHIMKADVMSMVATFNKAGVAVTDYKIEPVKDVNSGFEIHTVKLVPVVGAPSSFRFTLPIINERGEYKDRGTKYRMRKQWADLPIRKISETRVGLTTYYSKLFVDRSTKKVNDYGKWLRAKLVSAADEEVITDVGYDSVFDNTKKTPSPFSSISSFFTHFTAGDFSFVWDYSKLEELVGSKVMKAAISNNEIPCGKTKSGEAIIMGEAGIMYVHGTDEILGTIEEILGIDQSKSPIEIATLDIMGKKIPIGLILAYYFGFSKLLRMLKVPHRNVRRGSALDLQSDEFVVRFKDQSLIIPKTERLACLIIGSFTAYKNSIGSYDLNEFDGKDVYSAVLDIEGLGIRYFREFKLLDDMYIDPISEEILREMKEPTEFPRLLLRAAELLTTDDYPNEKDARFRRVRGYERISGHLYAQMVVGLRYHRAGENNPKSTVDINPIAVQAKINQDPSIAIVNEINPIENLKETENLTYGGTGGRSGLTMVKSTRAYDKTELGIVSEATVDSSDVGVTTSLAPNPKFKDLRGLRQDWEFDDTETSSLLSTSSLVSPCSDGEDPKRRAFITIQQSHVIAAEGYTVSPIRTGYEDVIAQRTGDLFSFPVKADGKVEEVVEGSHVRVSYKDPDLADDIFELGTRYGKSAGHVISHKLVCDLKVGTKVKAGDIAAYNVGFFERSLFNPNLVSWKSGVLTSVAIMDTPDTFEDSCAISPALADKLLTTHADTREITIRFDQVIRNLVQEGEVVDHDSILCTIEDAATAQSDAFDQDVMDALRMRAQSAPTAKSHGTVGEIDIIYHGDLDDMNDGLRALVTKYDRKRAKRAKQLGKDILNGEVSDLDMDTVVIRVTIEGPLAMGDGHKVVFGNQLKSIPNRIFVGEHTDMYGRPLDAVFGGASILDRIVTSAEKMGMVNVLLRLNGKRAAAAYRNYRK